MEALILH